MANALYVKGKEKMLQGQINWLTDTIKAALVKSAYTVDLAAHEFLSDLGANVLNTNQALSGRSVTGGVFDANPMTWPSVTAGDTASFVVLFKDTGVAGTSPLLMYLDTITNFPVSTNGSDVTAQDNGGANKIFSL
ncbi:MAG: hypothetical protein A2Y38_16580 [Spirochaetes bacterium GWB1_59_5]|nr:MAG: hypothetical protein A2Y38_16580 [Spirochaetes bacterium GWB1_59_5]